jgi:hypothetical protein
MEKLQAQRVSWLHYIFAAFLSYLAPWLAAFLDAFIWQRILSHPINRFDLEQSHFSTSVWLIMIIPAVINFLILLPFLRFPIRRQIAYFCICIGWLILLWFSHAETR